MTETIHNSVSISILKAAVRDGILKAHPEGGSLVPEVNFEIPLGRIRVKSRPVGPDAISTIYLNDQRLYKVMVDCRQSRDPLEMIKMVETKLDKESFNSQASKVLTK